jgi:hypothetical protein
MLFIFSIGLFCFPSLSLSPWPSLSILIFGGEKKLGKLTDTATILQEICAHAAAADGAHIVCARHAGSEDEVNTGPQRTEKQVESGIQLRKLRVLILPRPRPLLLPSVLTVCLIDLSDCRPSVRPV